MNVHHLNCGAMRPYGGALMDGRTRGMGPATLTCHCLLLESEEGLVLVDTGTVSADPANDRAAIEPMFLAMNRIVLDPTDSALHRVLALGYAALDVRHIVMTHLDFDHAAGLRDFPGATVHVSAAEAHAARHPAGPIGRKRYAPKQWGDIGRWQRHDAFETDWFGIPASDVMPGVSLVWLPGHTEGHCGVAVRTDGGWLLHAGDAVLNGAELAARPRTPTGARFYQWMMEASQVRRRRSLWDLRRLVQDHATEVSVICTHDPAQFSPQGGADWRRV